MLCKHLEWETGEKQLSHSNSVNVSLLISLLMFSTLGRNLTGLNHSFSYLDIILSIFLTYM